MTSRIVSLLYLLVLTTARLSVSQLIQDEDREFLLDLHNDARDNVDPIATNMEKMVSCMLATVYRQFSAGKNETPERENES